MENKIERVQILFYLSLALTVGALFAALMAGGRIEPGYYWGIIAVPPLLVAALVLHFQLSRLKTHKRIKDRWGKVDRIKRDFKSIPLYFRRDDSDETKTLVDDHTWNDLNMNDIFALLDRTITNPGESVLYSILRTPCAPDSAQVLKDRGRLISLLQEDTEARERLQLALIKMEKQDNNEITHLLWEKLPPKNPMAMLYSLLALAALLVLPLPFWIGSRGILLIIAVYSLNSILHYKVSGGFSFQVPAISSLARMLRTAQVLGKLDLKGFEDLQEQLNKATVSAHRITRKTRFLIAPSATSDLFFIYQYLNLTLLIEVRSFYGVLEEIKRQIRDLRQIYRIIGLMDSLQSIASYRANLDYTEPQFTSVNSLKVKDIRHPLLADPTANSIEIQNQGILITGSNMAGKSTFLRTLGVNAILAQSINTCLAAEYTASYLQVISSINKVDDISQNKSLYYAEAERLLHIIQPAFAKLPALCLIDELLSGTNYTERIAASEAILDYLKGKNALVVVATHDLDLAVNLKGSYQCYHFSDKVDKNNLQFDYTLKSGIATTRNAIKLLEYLGYPQEIVQGANRGYQS